VVRTVLDARIEMLSETIISFSIVTLSSVGERVNSTPSSAGFTTTTLFAVFANDVGVSVSSAKVVTVSMPRASTKSFVTRLSMSVLTSVSSVPKSATRASHFFVSALYCRISLFETF